MNAKSGCESLYRREQVRSAQNRLDDRMEGGWNQRLHLQHDPNARALPSCVLNLCRDVFRSAMLTLVTKVMSAGHDQDTWGRAFVLRRIENHDRGPGPLLRDAFDGERRLSPSEIARPEYQ